VLKSLVWFIGMLKKKIKAYSTNVLDYPSAMSMFEKESLAAEATLARKGYRKQLPKEKPGSGGHKRTRGTQA
jgi:hypothetical protein